MPFPADADKARMPGIEGEAAGGRRSPGRRDEGGAAVQPDGGTEHRFAGPVSRIRVRVRPNSGRRM